MAIVLDGEALSRRLEASLAEHVARLKREADCTPTLATVLVGGDPASAMYVKMKGNACRRVGMVSLRVLLPQATTTERLLD